MTLGAGTSSATYHCVCETLSWMRSLAYSVFVWPIRLTGYAIMHAFGDRISQAG